MQDITHSSMVYVRVADEDIHLELMYTTFHILTVISIKQLVNRDGEPTMLHKLETSVKPSV